MEKEDIKNVTFYANQLINILGDFPEDVIDYVLNAVTENYYVSEDEIEEILISNITDEGGVY